MYDGWEVARQRQRMWEKAPRSYVSINKRGEIAMNAEAFRRIMRPASVTLLYDAKHRRIGVKFPIAIDSNFFPVRSYGRGRRMRIVRAARMFKQFGIKIDRTLIYKNAETQNLDGHPMLVLDLDEG